MSAEGIIKSVVAMLRHLQTIPLEEVRENIQVMIDEIQSSEQKVIEE